MAGIAKSDGDAVGHRNGPVVIQSDELPHGLFGVVRAVERLDGRQVLLGALFGNELGIGALNLRRILQHNAGQVACRESAVDVARKTLPAQVGQVPAMVNMRVTENGRVDLLRREREIAVALDRLGAFALKKSAFQKQPLLIDFQQIHRAGGRARGAEEMDLHRFRMPSGKEIASFFGKVGGYGWRKVMRALPRS